MAEAVDSIVDVRKAFMVASTEGDHKPILRTAHFLKPTLLNGNPPPLSPSSLPLSSNPSKWPLKIDFKNWVYQPQDWTQWVDQMEANYGRVWKKVGIFDAVKASATIRITKDSNVILELAQKWSPETNTFIFRWGEATVTLEDVKVIGGYSVLGSPVSTPLETDEMTEVEQELEKARADVARGKWRKPGITPWIKKFMGSGDKIEHEAFLACWLSCFVFNKNKVIKADVFKVAVHLARGTRIALAPAVLASIYRDLTVIKKHVFRFAQGVIEAGESIVMLPVWAPFVLVQAWIWERFPSLSPRRTEVRFSEPRIAIWHDNPLTPREKNLGSALESKKFQWRPYTEPLMNSEYNENSEKWVLIHSRTHEELLSFAKFLIPSQLVGLDGVIEHYFPNRVSMQFGFDQDLPGSVIFHDLDLEVVGKKLYVPSGSFNPSITDRYRIWWEKMKHGAEVVGLSEGIPDSLRDILRHLQTSVPNPMNDAVPSHPPGFKRKVIELDSSDEEDGLTIKELVSSNSRVRSCKSMSSQNDASSFVRRLQTSVPNPMSDAVLSPFPPGFKRKVIELDLSDEEDEMRIKELVSSNSRVRSCKSMSSQNDASSFVGSSIAKDISIGNNNLLEQDEEEEEEIVDLANCDEPDIEADDSLNGIEGTKSAGLKQRNGFSARMNNMRDRLTKIEHTFAEVKEAWLARN